MAFFVLLTVAQNYQFDIATAVTVFSTVLKCNSSCQPHKYRMGRFVSFSVCTGHCLKYRLSSILITAMPRLRLCALSNIYTV